MKKKSHDRISSIINNTIRCSHNHWNNGTVYISIEVWRTNTVIDSRLLEYVWRTVGYGVECDRARDQAHRMKFILWIQCIHELTEKLLNSYRAKKQREKIYSVVYTHILMLFVCACLCLDSTTTFLCWICSFVRSFVHLSIFLSFIAFSLSFFVHVCAFQYFNV